MRSDRNSSFRHLVLLVMTIATGCVLAQSANAQTTTQWKQTSEHWYIMELAGGRAGWSRDVVETNGEQYRTINETSIRIGRMSEEATIYMSSSFVETLNGQPVSIALTSKMSSQTTETNVKFTDEAMEQTVTQGGRTTTKMLPSPEGDWLPPQALDRFITTQLEAKAKQFTYRTIEPQNGLEVLEVQCEYLREETYKFGDREIPVTVLKSIVKFGNMPGIISTEMYSSDHVLVYTKTSMGMGDMIMRHSSKKDAMSDDGGEAPELIFSTFVTADRPLDNGMHAMQTRYRLTLKEGEMPPFPTAGAQRVTNEKDGVVTLLVDIDDNVAASEGDTDLKEYLESSTLIDMDNPLVEKLATRALRGAGEGTMERADALYEFVYKHISDKNMGTAFASAGETAMTRTGDCSEHAVLLAAMMRAAKIPSRVATGLVFMTNRENKAMFGWHMWTQALIDGRWVDFDATLPVRYNSGHILTSTSSFSDSGSSSELMSLFLLMGNLEIEILDEKTAVETAPAE